MNYVILIMWGLGNYWGILGKDRYPGGFDTYKQCIEVVASSRLHEVSASLSCVKVDLANKIINSQKAEYEDSI